MYSIEFYFDYRVFLKWNSIWYSFLIGFWTNLISFMTFNHMSISCCSIFFILCEYLRIFRVNPKSLIKLQFSIKSNSFRIVIFPRIGKHPQIESNQYRHFGCIAFVSVYPIKWKEKHLIRRHKIGATLKTNEMKREKQPKIQTRHSNSKRSRHIHYNWYQFIICF